MGVGKISVDYVELGEEFGFRGGIDPNGMVFQIKPYLIAFADLNTFLTEMRGTTQVSGGLGGRLTANLPFQCPADPRLYAYELSWVPEGQLLWPTSPIQYSYAIVTVNFKQPEFNYQGTDDPGFDNSISQDPTENAAMYHATQQVTFGREWITIPNSAVMYKSDGKIVTASKGLSYVVHTMLITYSNFPYFPMTLFRSYADTLNNATFLGCGIGTVMFEGAVVDRDFNANSTVSQQIQLNFKWRAQDWNKQLRDDTLTWDYVVDKTDAIGAGLPGAGKANFSYANYAPLLLWATS
jgi:hypothetical protein